MRLNDTVDYDVDVKTFGVGKVCVWQRERERGKKMNSFFFSLLETGSDPNVKNANPPDEDRN